MTIVQTGTFLRLDRGTSNYYIVTTGVNQDRPGRTLMYGHLAVSIRITQGVCLDEGNIHLNIQDLEY